MTLEMVTSIMSISSIRWTKDRYKKWLIFVITLFILLYLFDCRVINCEKNT